MSAHNCGCDPEAKWKCRDFPDCAGARAERERKIELVEKLMKNGLEAIRAQELELPDELQTGKWEGVVPVRDVPELTLNEYQCSLHTYKDRHHECHALGLVGELAEVLSETVATVIAAGNVADMVKKATAHGVPLDREKLKKELGDVLWYITAVASDNALSMDDIAKANIKKLQERYPNGFVKGGGVRAAEVGDKAFLRELERQGIVARVELPPVKKAHAVHFSCGCSETVIDDVLTRSYCPNGECRKLTR